MSEVFDAVTNDYTEFAEPEHFDEVLQGALDTFDGLESLSTTYTKAQQYLFACMSAADVIDYKQQVAGMEGVLTAIGNGLSSAWEYVKKMFKAVWNAFFGKGDDTIEAKGEATEKKIKDNKDKVDALAKSGKPAAQVEEITKKVKAKATKIKNDPKSSSGDKAKADNIIKRIDDSKGKSSSQKETDLHGFLEALPQIDKQSRELLIKRVGEAEALRKKYVTYAEQDRSKDIGQGRFRSMYKIFRETLTQGAFHTSISDLVKVDNIRSMMMASNTQTKLIDLVEAHSKFAKFITSEKTEFETEIKELETALSKDAEKGTVLDEKYKSKDEVRARLKAANTALSIVNATAGFQTKMFNALERLSNSITEVFGDYTDTKVVI